MVNPFQEVNWNPDRAARRQFATSLLIGFPCLALAALLAGRLFKGSWHANLILAQWLAGAGAGAGAVFWLAPPIVRPFYTLWYFLACCMGWVMGNLLLGGFFYLLLTPFGLVKRLSKPALTKGFDKSAQTYWRTAKMPEDPARYYQQF